MITPLDQFEIYKIYEILKENKYIDINLYNGTIFLLFNLFLLNLLFFLPSSRYFWITIYNGIENLIPGIPSKYIPIAISCFNFLLINNLLGLIPYSITITAQIIITGTMSLTIIIGITIIGLLKHKYKFYKLFIPAGLDNMKTLIPFIFFIEILSYLIRILSLSIRLAANMISGHTLIHIISYFTSIGLIYFSKISLLLKIISLPLFIGLPFIFIIMIYLLEIGVAIIQSYVFTLLTLIYIKDSELLH